MPTRPEPWQRGIDAAAATARGLSHGRCSQAKLSEDTRPQPRMPTATRTMQTKASDVAHPLRPPLQAHLPSAQEL
eukprot:3365369-Karenia_brevis.AAC.1